MEYFSFTVPQKVVSKDFACFVGTANLRNKYLQSRTISITSMIPSQRIVAPNSIFNGVVLGRSFGEIATLL